MASLLFSPTKLRSLELANRIVVAPMCQYSADDGSRTDWYMMHLGQFAVSGAALVFVEASGVEAAGRSAPRPASRRNTCAPTRPSGANRSRATRRRDLNPSA